MPHWAQKSKAPCVPDSVWHVSQHSYCNIRFLIVFPEIDALVLSSYGYWCAVNSTIPRILKLMLSCTRFKTQDPKISSPLNTFVGECVLVFQAHRVIYSKCRAQKADPRVKLSFRNDTTPNVMPRCTSFSCVVQDHLLGLIRGTNAKVSEIYPEDVSAAERKVAQNSSHLPSVVIRISCSKSAVDRRTQALWSRNVPEQVWDRSLAFGDERKGDRFPYLIAKCW